MVRSTLVKRTEDRQTYTVTADAKTQPQTCCMTTTVAYSLQRHQPTSGVILSIAFHTVSSASQFTKSITSTH